MLENHRFLEYLLFQLGLAFSLYIPLICSLRYECQGVGFKHFVLHNVVNYLVSFPDPYFMLVSL